LDDTFSRFRVEVVRVGGKNWWGHFGLGRIFLGGGRDVSVASALSGPLDLLPSTHRMHLALKAYQELLATVNEMDLSPDEAVRESSRIIKSEAPACSLVPAFSSIFPSLLFALSLSSLVLRQGLSI
jgi:hypothetical protein